jgi:hypothetical protein
MSTKASTAALDRECQRLFLRRRRGSCRPASGRASASNLEGQWKHMEVKRTPQAGQKENTMNGKGSVKQETISRSIYRGACGRAFLAVLLGSMAIVGPAIAAASPLPHKEIRVPRVDRLAIENLQRWVSGGHDTWCKDARLVALAEMGRIAPEFAVYEYDLVSLPLETKRQAATRAEFTYTSLDGRKTYRITLQRYAWLLPLAGGDSRSIVWVPSRTEIITNP